jgi:hypothetical protein
MRHLTTTCFGFPVAGGDVNGDGVGDVLVGASCLSDFSELAFSAGQAYVFLGPELSTVLTLRNPTPREVTEFGLALASGDVNGDGIGDVVVGAPDSLNDEPGAGETFVFLGPDLQSVIPLPSPVSQAGARMGQAVTVGDVNGDGIGDAVVGIPLADVDGVQGAGQVVVFFGG